jgi:hypothetical protein
MIRYSRVGADERQYPTKYQNREGFVSINANTNTPNYSENVRFTVEDTPLEICGKTNTSEKDCLYMLAAGCSSRVVPACQRGYTYSLQETTNQRLHLPGEFTYIIRPGIHTRVAMTLYPTNPNQ